MKGSEESYSVIVFRGARANPLRIKLRKSTVRYSLIAGICLLVIQSGILTHYFFQRSQLAIQFFLDLNCFRSKKPYVFIFL